MQPAAWIKARFAPLSVGRAPRALLAAALTAPLFGACAPMDLPSPDVSALPSPKSTAPAKPSPPGLTYQPTTFAALPGWRGDNPSRALIALNRSCARLATLPANRELGQGPDASRFGGRAADWRGVCGTAARTQANDGAAARRFFQNAFTPHLISGSDGPTGLFTGYYEAELHGSRKRDARYSTPIYAKPSDLVSVDLGKFRKKMKSQRLSGRMKGKTLVPFDNRAEIDAGSLANRAQVLLWVDSPVDAFFLHVQGSGRVRMTDGSVVRLGFAGRNGHAYTSIGAVLIRRGELTRDEVSMQTIRRWIEARPRAGRALMASNPSYIFFREMKARTGGPVGSQGVALEPGRSLAVDRRYIALSLPVWLDTTHPDDPSKALRRLVIAQDTGGAIRGAVRGDLFWGFGKDAARRAGLMKQAGRAFVLVPNAIARRLSTRR